MSDMDWARREFERCKPWIKDALDRSIGEATLDNVLQELVEGSAQIWPTPNSVVISAVRKHLSGLRVCNCWLAGGDLDEIMATEKAIEQWAREAGCHGISIFGRRGWLRVLPDYREACTVMWKDLR